MDSSRDNGVTLGERLGNLVLGVAVTLAMTALLLSGADFEAGNATGVVDPHAGAKVKFNPASTQP